MPDAAVMSILADLPHPLHVTFDAIWESVRSTRRSARDGDVGYLDQWNAAARDAHRSAMQEAKECGVDPWSPRYVETVLLVARILQDYENGARKWGTAEEVTNTSSLKMSLASSMLWHLRPEGIEDGR